MEFAARASRLSVSATAAMMIEAERLRAQGRDLVDFGVGEPDFPTPAHVTEAAIAALRSGQTKYTATGGSLAMRQAVARAHQRDFQSDYTPAEVLTTAGGKHALFNAMSVLVDHGDEVILPSPYWVSFHDQITYCGGRPILVPTDEADGFSLSLEAVERALTPRTKIILLNSPSNPSGAVFSPATFQGVLEICRKRSLWLVSDECYVKLLYDQPAYSVASEPGAKQRILIAGSLSKSYAMTGWRLGYALGPANVIAAMLSLQSHTTGNPTSFVQAGAIAALTGDQAPVAAMLAEYRERRSLIVAGLRAIAGVSCVMPGGAFYAYPNISRLLRSPGGPDTAPDSAIEFSRRLLQEAGVVTVAGEAFGSHAHIRLSYATSRATIAEGLKRLAAFSALLK